VDLLAHLDLGVQGLGCHVVEPLEDLVYGMVPGWLTPTSRRRDEHVILAAGQLRRLLDPASCARLISRGIDDPGRAHAPAGLAGVVTAAFFTVLLRTAAFFTVLFGAVAFFTVLFGAVAFFTVLLRTAAFFTVLFGAAAFFAARFGAAAFDGAKRSLETSARSRADSACAS